jgi:tetratricopeptide (TPR) repeat protein
MLNTFPRRLGRWAMLLILTIVSALTASGTIRSWRQPDPGRLRRQALSSFISAHFDRADDALRRLCQQSELMAEDWMLRAQVDMALGRDVRALASLARVQDTHALAPRAQLQSGQIELRRHRARAAEAAFLRALRLDPRLVQARRELIYIYGMQMRRAELSAQFRALAELVPLGFNDVQLWCLTRTALWDPDEVCSVLEAFVRADPEDRASRLALADNLRRWRPDEAETALAALPESGPDVRALRIRLAMDRGDTRAACALLSGGPVDHPVLARFRGRLALERRDFPAAVRHFRAALATEPNDRDTLFQLGNALRLCGDVAAGLPLMKAAHDLDALLVLIEQASTPQGRRDPKVLFALGAACEAVHRLPEARAWYRLALDRDPIDRQTQGALFRLGSSSDRPQHRDSGHDSSSSLTRPVAGPETGVIGSEGAVSPPTNH